MLRKINSDPPGKKMYVSIFQKKPNIASVTFLNVLSLIKTSIIKEI